MQGPITFNVRSLNPFIEKTWVALGNVKTKQKNLQLSWRARPLDFQVETLLKTLNTILPSLIWELSLWTQKKCRTTHKDLSRLLHTQNLSDLTMYKTHAVGTPGWDKTQEAMSFLHLVNIGFFGITFTHCYLSIVTWSSPCRTPIILKFLLCGEYTPEPKM